MTHTDPAAARAVTIEGMNKYYGAGSGSLWAGKGLALIATHGYDADYGAGTLLVGLQRLCEHSHLNWLGAYTVRDTDGIASRVTAKPCEGARQFARECCGRQPTRDSGWAMLHKLCPTIYATCTIT